MLLPWPQDISMLRFCLYRPWRTARWKSDFLHGPFEAHSLGRHARIRLVLRHLISIFMHDICPPRSRFKATPDADSPPSWDAVDSDLTENDLYVLVSSVSYQEAQSYSRKPTDRVSTLVLLASVLVCAQVGTARGSPHWLENYRDCPGTEPCK